MKTLLAIALVAPMAMLLPFPTAQGTCVPTAETFGVTAVGNYYVKNDAVIGYTATGTVFATDRAEIFNENNNIPGLQATRDEACGAKPDTDMIGLRDALTTDPSFYACTVGYVPDYCPLTAYI